MKPLPADVPRDAVVETALPPRHTDWLWHRMRVHGDPSTIAALQRAAAGPGMIPWQIDYDALEERLWHRLIAGPLAQRSISVAAARLLSRQLRDASERRQSAALSQADRRSCSFDLHRLVPVPPAILALGPEDPRADAWLWEHWGTTEPLRHANSSVQTAPDAPQRLWSLTFWAADWTPWRAIAQLRTEWPDLRLDVQPSYG
jgi:hypothetical protein